MNALMSNQSVNSRIISTYEEFNEKRDFISNLLSRLKALSSNIELSEESKDNFIRMEHLVNSNRFRVIIIGSFSRGKSTMINALLGNKILPAKLTPTTAVITVIKYGEQPAAKIYYRDSSLSPREIPVEELPQYLVIPKKQYNNDSATLIDNTIEMVEIYYPLELCKNGVEIIDSPGLEEDLIRQEITMRFLRQCDAAVVVLSCQQLLTLQEEHFIDNELKKRGFNKLFYVLNFADVLSQEDEQDIWDRVHYKFGDSERIFMVSARQALNGKINNDLPMLEQSGFLPFEKALENFLVQEPGQVKLQTCQTLLQNFINELESLMKIKLNLLETKQIEELEWIEQEFKARQQAILRQKEEILSLIGEKGVLIGEKLMSSYNKKCRAICSELPGVAANITDEEIAGSIWKRRQYQEDVQAYLLDWIREQIREWNETEANEIIRIEAERLQNMINRELNDLIRSVDQLRLLIDPSFQPDIEHDTQGFERLMAAAGALLLGDIGTAVTGGALGVKGAIVQLGGVALANAV